MNPTIQTGSRFWQAHVNALARSGYSRSEYCRRHNLSYHALTYWVNKQPASNKATPRLALIEVSNPLAEPMRRTEAALRLHLGGNLMIEIEPDFDDATLGRILTVLAQQR